MQNLRIISHCNKNYDQKHMDTGWCHFLLGTHMNYVTTSSRFHCNNRFLAIIFFYFPWHIYKIWHMFLISVKTWERSCDYFVLHLPIPPNSFNLAQGSLCICMEWVLHQAQILTSGGMGKRYKYLCNLIQTFTDIRASNIMNICAKL